MPLSIYSKDSTDALLADKLDLAGGTMTGGLTLSATGLIFSDSTTMTTAPAGGALAADQLTDGVVAVNPAAGPTAAGDVLQYDGTVLIWTPGAGASLPLAGGAMNADAVVTLSDTSNHDSELAGWGLGVQLTNDHAQGTTVEFNGLDTYDSSGHLHINPTGITFPDTTVQTTAGYPNTNPSGFQTSGDVSTYVTGLGYLTDAPIDGFSYNRKNGAWDVAGSGGSVAWGAITGTLTNQTDLTSYVTGLGYQTAGDVSTYVTGLGYQTAGDVSTYVSANAYPLSGNPSNFLTSVPGPTINTVSSGPYTLAVADANNIVRCSSFGSNYLYLPDDSTAAIPVGSRITILNDQGTTLSVTSSGTAVLLWDYGSPINIPGAAGATAVKVATDTWFLIY